jgi:hypothetical protein
MSGEAEGVADEDRAERTRQGDDGRDDERPQADAAGGEQCGQYCVQAFSGRRTLRSWITHGGQG